jgi:rSAM/selenodomain-associated transferase 1
MSMKETAATVGSCAMAVMGKASVPGRAKTRLIPEIGAENAARLNTAFLQDITANLLQAGTQMPISAYVAYGPAGAEQFFRDHLPDQVRLVESSLPDFGGCLFHAITTMLDRGHFAACVVNADSPTLPTGYLIEAARQLALPGDRAVLGPSTDGGYYFLGIKAPHRRLFEEIAWSTPSVAAQTRCRAIELGLELITLKSWYDVDDGMSLKQLMSEISQPPPRSLAEPASYAAPNTRAALDAMFDRSPCPMT